MKCILAACIRNEGPYILEWYCHHKNLGFNQFIVYSNDNTDGSDELLNEMHRLGLVDWRPRVLETNESPQLTAYKHLYSDLLSSPQLESRYLLWLDMDEFLVLKKHKSIQELISDYNCPDGISFNWKHFGSSGIEKYDGRPTMERFLLASSKSDLNLLIKTIAKIDSEIFSQINNHRPQPVKDVSPYVIYPALNDGLRVPDEVLAGKDPRELQNTMVVHDVAQLNHYSIRSFQEFEWKRARGNGRLPVSDARCDFLDSYFTARDLNHEVDDYAHRSYSGEVAKALTRLPGSLLKIHRKLISELTRMSIVETIKPQRLVAEATIDYVPVHNENLIRFKLDRTSFPIDGGKRNGYQLGGVAVSKSSNSITSISLIDKNKRVVQAKLGLPSPGMGRLYKGKYNSKYARFVIAEAPLQIMESPAIQIQFDDGSSCTPARIASPSTGNYSSCLPRYSHSLDFLNMAEIIRERIKDKKIIYIANKGNYGDSLIRHGTLKFFREYGFSFTEVRKDDVFDAAESDLADLKKIVCLYGGSGAWCRITPGASSIVARLSDQFSDVIVLPSTYEIRPEFRDNLMLWARGGKESFVNSSGYFCHDMAFMIGSIKCRQGEGDGYLYRTDSEASGALDIPVSNHDISAVANNYANPFSFFDYLSKFSRLYTDRLHVAIAGALLGKEVHLTSSAYFKTREIYESSILGFYDNIHFYNPNAPLHRASSSSGAISAIHFDTFRERGASAFNASSDDLALIAKIKSDRITYLSRRKMISLLTACRKMEEDKIPGIFLEAGCGLGGSTVLIGKAKSSSRLLYVFDVFGQIPPPTESDTSDAHRRYQVIAQGKSKGISGDTYYGYQDDLIGTVRSNLTRYGLDLQANEIHLVQGLLQDTFRPQHQVAFAHIDVDWYDPVKLCLERIYPLLVPGGMIILDDYYDWGGCQKAVDEFLQIHRYSIMADKSAGSIKLVKLSTD